LGQGLAELVAFNCRWRSASHLERLQLPLWAWRSRVQNVEGQEAGSRRADGGMAVVPAQTSTARAGSLLRPTLL
jgi:hypothetical protein